jgi:hypothetical protein
MNGRDTHSALKSEIVETINAGHLEVVLARLQWGKDDIHLQECIAAQTLSSSRSNAPIFTGHIPVPRMRPRSLLSPQSNEPQPLDGRLPMSCAR